MADSGPTSSQGACDALVNRLAQVGTEQVALADAFGRVLAEPIVADRDSPAADVSAMDGYAVRTADLALGRMPVAGEAAMGQRPPELPAGAAIRIVTGGGVPAQADAVVRREDVRESPDEITFDPALAGTLKPGVNIRRAGENLGAGERAVDAGVIVTAPVVAALAAFGVTSPMVRQRVRVTVITTGDEVLSAADSPGPWQLRDANNPMLSSVLGAQPWIEVLGAETCADDPDLIERSIARALDASDAVFLSGGVSMGHRDFVPGAIERAGCETVFHRLPQRPGKPLLGAVGPRGQCVLGFPGNPVAVMVMARRIGEPALSSIAGRAPSPPNPVRIDGPDGRSIGLWWFRLARRLRSDRVELVEGKGSGDVVSAACSDGFVELAPGDSGDGGVPFYSWGWA